MYTLYIDTHSIKLVLALFKDDEVLKKIEVTSAEHSKNVVLNINNMLKEHELEVTDLNEIIVIIGPGSFTGVRIGVVIAKMIAYTKNILVKPISFLEAASLSYDNYVTLGIKDRNGAFVASFNSNHELVEDYEYINNQDLESYPKEIIYQEEVDLNRLIHYVKNKDVINPHLLKPLYVKKIEVLK